MVLELDRTTVGVGLVGRRLEPVGSAPELFVILHEDSVVDERDACPFGELAVLVKAGPAKGDVVGLPLSRGARGVAKRRILAVNRPGLAIGVGIGLVQVDDLQLKSPMRKMPLLPQCSHGPYRQAGWARPTQHAVEYPQIWPWSRSVRFPGRFP